MRLLFLLITLLPIWSLLSHATVVEKRFTVYDGLPHHHATSIVQDGDGLIWISTWNALSRFDGYRFTTFKPKPGDGSAMNVDRIKEIRIKGYHIFCNVEHKCFIFDIRDGKYTDIEMSWNDAVKRYGLSPKTPRHLTDHSGIRWSIDSLGVKMAYTRPSYSTRLLKQPGCQVRMLLRDKDGLIWVASRDDRTVRLYDASLRLLGFLGSDGVVHKERQTFLAPIYCMYQDKDGTFWIGSKPCGLMRMSKVEDGRYEVSPVGEGQIGREVYDIKQDRWKRLWIATMDKGLACIPNPHDPSRISTVWNGGIKIKEAETFKSVRCLHITREDVLLAGTTQGLLVTQLTAQSPAHNTFNAHTREGNRYNSLSNSAIMYIQENVAKKRQMIDICTEGGGVNLLRNEHLLSPTLDFLHMDKQLLPNDFLSSTFTYDGITWFVSTKDLIGIKVGTHQSMAFDHDNWDDRMLFSDATPLHLGGGRWLFGLMDGAAVIDLDMLRHDSFVPKLILTSVLIEGKEQLDAVSVKETISLNEHQRNVQVSFSALDYRNSSSLQYRFKLDGSSWNYLNEDHSVTLLGLSPGKHELSIEPKLVNGSWSGDVKRVIIIVTPTVWQTTTAKVLYVLLTLALILGIWYFVTYFRQMHRKQRELLESYLSLLQQKEDNSTEETRKEGEPQKQLSEEEKVLMQKIVQYVNDNLENTELNVNELAAHVGVSNSGLNRKMKSLLGVTPKEFIIKARMNHAAQLLMDTTLNVKEIAYQCGFSDQNYFGKSFKAIYGISPSEYRVKKRH